MKFHPLVSIIIGLIVFFILSELFGFLFGINPGNIIFLYAVIYLIAGFTATYLTEEKKIRYGIFEGLSILILTNLDTIISGFSMPSLSTFIIASLLTIIITGIGGVIANKLDNTLNNRELSERYLVCDTCGGYYKLKAGENPDGYSSECECGGNLTYERTFEHDEED